MFYTFIKFPIKEAYGEKWRFLFFWFQLATYDFCQYIVDVHNECPQKLMSTDTVQKSKEVSNDARPLCEPVAPHH